MLQLTRSAPESIHLRPGAAAALAATTVDRRSRQAHYGGSGVVDFIRLGVTPRTRRGDRARSSNAGEACRRRRTLRRLPSALSGPRAAARIRLGRIRGVALRQRLRRPADLQPRRSCRWVDALCTVVGSAAVLTTSALAATLQHPRRRARAATVGGGAGGSGQVTQAPESGHREPAHGSIVIIRPCLVSVRPAGAGCGLKAISCAPPGVRAQSINLPPFPSMADGRGSCHSQPAKDVGSRQILLDRFAADRNPSTPGVMPTYRDASLAESA